jgi:hypothetical protein
MSKNYTRELLSDTNGSVHLEVEGNALDFEVIMERRSGILVELSTTGNDKSEEFAIINAATLESGFKGYKLVVPVPENVTIFSGFSGSRTVMTGGSFTQIGHGNVQVNSFGGRRGRFTTGTVLEHGIKVKVYLPENSSLFSRKAGGLSVSGNAGDINADLNGADVYFERASSVEIETSGGDIDGQFVAYKAVVRTSGGDIRLGETRGLVDLKTSGGNISIDVAHGDGEMRTSGGNLTLGQFFGRSMRMKTSGGNIRHPQHAGIQAKTSGGRVNGKSAW